MVCRSTIVPQERLAKAKAEAAAASAKKLAEKGASAVQKAAKVRCGRDVRGPAMVTVPRQGWAGDRSRGGLGRWERRILTS